MNVTTIPIASEAILLMCYQKKTSRNFNTVKLDGLLDFRVTPTPNLIWMFNLDVEFDNSDTFDECHWVIKQKKENYF